MRYFIELSYKGTAYNGWQRQDNAPSVQQTLEEALSKYLRTEITVTGAGRTDTGVHADYYVLHFDHDQPIADTEDFVYHLNSMLPHDIALRSLQQVDDNAHARFDALSREYKYYIVLKKDPFCRDIAWQYNGELDIDAMNEAAETLLFTEDFTTFAKLHSANKTNICKVTRAEWKRCDNELVFTIRADRFLRNMVRAITGTLVDVGRGKITVDEFTDIVQSHDLARSGGSAPAQGLFLTDIQYRPETFKRNK